MGGESSPLAFFNGLLGELLSPLRHIERKLKKDREAWIEHEFPGMVRPSDVLQVAYLDAIRHFHEFRGNTFGELCAWFRVILKRNGLDLVRRFLRDKRDARREVALDAVSASGHVRQETSRREVPVEVAVHAEEVELVREAVAALDGINRRVVELHIF